MHLTPRQERFASEYLVDLNATQAAIRAGYSARTAKEQGYKLLTKPQVQAAVEAGQTARGERLKATADDVLREITRLAMFDPASYTDVKGPDDVKKLPEDVRRAIVGWSWDKQGRFTLKFAKESALEMMGRHHSLFKERIEHSGPAGGPIEHEHTAKLPESVERALDALAGAAKAGSSSPAVPD